MTDHLPAKAHISSVALQPAFREAETIIEAADHLKLSESDSFLVLDLLENPSPANARLRTAAMALPLATIESLPKELGKLSP